MGKGNAHLADGMRLEAPGIHDLGQRRLVERQTVGSVRNPEVDASVHGLPACHKRRSRRAAARLDVVLRQRDPTRAHLVEIWRCDLAAIRVSHVVEAQVLRHRPADAGSVLRHSTRFVSAATLTLQAALEPTLELRARDAAQTQTAQTAQTQTDIDDHHHEVLRVCCGPRCHDSGYMYSGEERGGETQSHRQESPRASHTALAVVLAGAAPPCWHLPPASLPYPLLARYATTVLACPAPSNQHRILTPSPAGLLILGLEFLQSYSLKKTCGGAGIEPTTFPESSAK